MYNNRYNLLGTIWEQLSFFLLKKRISKSLKLTYIKWLRELDLNQRPSGYESIKALFERVFTCNHNLSEFITNDYTT